MERQDNSKAFLATVMLLIATFCWGVSFPVMKALTIEEHLTIPTANSFFCSFAALCLRYGIACLVLFIICIPSLRLIKKREIVHGIILGIAIGFGSILQMDGLNYTTASTSAFLTSFYALLVPISSAIIVKKIPQITVWIACFLVLIGIAVLSGASFTNFTIGRGEAETLMASLFFTFQILYMERVDPARDNAIHITFIMCGAVTLIQLVPAISLATNPFDFITMHATTRSVVMLFILGLLSTVVPFILMNRFQPFVNASTAGIIYCAEPVFAAILAMILPEMLVRTRSSYANETLTPVLLIGGGLITLANILIQPKISSVLQFRVFLPSFRLKVKD